MAGVVNKGLIGRKIGMTQVFDPEGKVIPVTLIQAGPCVVVQKKTEEADGYTAIQLGFEDLKPKAVKKPIKGHFKKAGIPPKKYLREIRVSDPDKYQVGQEVKVDVFKEGEEVDVTGTSRGHGFTGAIKRHGFRRGAMAHGSKYHRRPGSHGATGPQKVFKGKKLPGRMGAERVTIKGLQVVQVDPERNIVMIKGSVPGVRGSLVLIKESV
jgi:large subunit ribosomal protein L3